MPVELRVAAPGDAEAAFRITRAGFDTYREFAGPGWEPPADMVDERVGERLASPEVWGVLAFDGTEAVGFGAFRAGRENAAEGRLIPGLAHVWAVFAMPSHWGRGVASAVLRALVDEIRRQGYSEARLFTPALQARARAFYAREGWREVSGALWVEILGLDVVELRRDV